MEIATGAPAPAQEGSAGPQLEQITRGVVALYKRHHGRGPTRAKTYLLDDRYVVTVVEEAMTTVAHTLVRHRRDDLVRQLWEGVQDAIAPELCGVVEEALGRDVVAHCGRLLTEADQAFAVFVLKPPGEAERTS